MYRVCGNQLMHTPRALMQWQQVTMCCCCVVQRGIPVTMCARLGVCSRAANAPAPSAPMPAFQHACVGQCACPCFALANVPFARSTAPAPHRALPLPLPLRPWCAARIVAHPRSRASLQRACATAAIASSTRQVPPPKSVRAGVGNRCRRTTASTRGTQHLCAWRAAALQACVVVATTSSTSIKTCASGAWTRRPTGAGQAAATSANASSSSVCHQTLCCHEIHPTFVSICEPTLAASLLYCFPLFPVV